jgi:hypothetical protein
MTIGLQAYLQGYMHEKTAVGPLVPEDGLTKSMASVLPLAAAAPFVPFVGGALGAAAIGRYAARKPLALGRHTDAERAKYYASPTTEEDLYWRYRRVPDSSLVPPDDRYTWPMDDYTRGVVDRLTAQRRARTARKLQATGENKGRTPISAYVGKGADVAYNVAKGVSERAGGYVAGKLEPLLKRYPRDTAK